ncbi:hypothetical protein HZA33_01665, partial [Candidatus Pacearchaeota archaeon]|nr:hypothetical protein [Candidatus Pacearchaeota archaeon]
FHLSTNRLAIWWLRTRVKLRARRFVFFACFIFLLILMQFLVSAQQTPSIPGEKEVQQLPYALNRTQSSFLKYYEGFTGFLSNTCTSLKQTTKHIIGIECSSTWVFVITLFLWLFMILIIADALTNFSTFSTLPSFLIAFALAVIAANLGVTKLISNLITAVFGSFVTGIIIGLIILGIIIVLKVTGEKFKQSREKAKEEKKETVFKKAELQTKMVGEALK